MPSLHYSFRSKDVHRDISHTSSHDAFWIFTLWRALHAGDATLSDIAAAVIANLSQYLPMPQDSFGVDPLPPSPEFEAVTAMDEAEEIEYDELDALPQYWETPPQPAFFCSDPRDFSLSHNYFNFKGVFYRIERPAFACLPTAA
jgi:hypothetical protein